MIGNVLSTSGTRSLPEPTALRHAEAHCQKWLRLGGLFLSVVGARLWLISKYGNSVPFWDQWDAEAAGLIQPILHRSFHWEVLFASHNEHRILCTRVIALLLFYMNRQWDPLLGDGF